MRSMIAILGALCLALSAVDCFPAAKYPEKSINVVVPLPAGGSVDVICRVVVDKLSKAFGTPIVVVNRVGTQIGMTEVIQTRPDGYTLGFAASSALTIQPILTDLPFKGPGDVLLIAMVAHAPVTLVAKPDAPWKTTKELIEAAKASPGKIRVAGSPIGSINFVNFSELADMGKGPFTYVPFGGGAQSLPAFLGGHAEGLVITPTEVKPHVAAGKAKILGVFAEKRTGILPDAPTMKEQGFDITREINLVMFGPKGLPDAVKLTLEETVKKVTADPDFATAVTKAGYEVSYRGSEELTKLLSGEYEKMRVLVDRLKLKQP